MPSSNDWDPPLGNPVSRSSAGIGGPSQVPADDDEFGIDVSDATIVELEDGFTFGATTSLHPDDLTERYEVFGPDALRELSSEETVTFLERNWLVDQGEA
jgi:hypothetical protein